MLSQKPIIGALMELSTERVSGMSVSSIPVSKVWAYLDRFDLPDWWEPILLQADAGLVAGLNRESGKSANNTHKAGRG